MNDTLDERKQFATLLTGLSDYYGKPLSKVTIRIYWEGLRQFDYEAIERAAWAHTQLPDDAGHWMPQISDIKKMMVGRTEDQAQLAWSKVDQAVRHVGVYEDVAFDDAIIHRVLADMGGWAPLGTKEDKEWPFIAKEFVTRYRGYKMNGQMPDYPRYLTGTASAHNVAEGFKSLAVRLIGNESAAREVIAGGRRVIGNQGPKQIEGAA